MHLFYYLLLFPVSFVYVTDIDYKKFFIQYCENIKISLFWIIINILFVESNFVVVPDGSSFEGARSFPGVEGRRYRDTLYTTPYSKLYTVHHSIQYTVHCTPLHTVHCTLYTTPYSTMYTVHHVIHCTLYTLHCTLYTIH